MQEKLNVPGNDDTATGALEDFIPAHDVPKRFPDIFGEAQWRYLLRIREANGLDRAVMKLNERRLLVHIPSLHEWLRSRLQSA